MRLAAILRPLVLCLALSALGGCAAISTVTGAGEQLEGFELRPLPPSGRAISGTRHLLVEQPTASGALDTDRIVIKPGPLQVEYLPGSRWVDEAPEHVQLLLARSLTGTGRFALVSTGGAQADADYYLLTDLQALQAELEPGDDTVKAVVRMKLTLVDDEEREIVAARTFEQVVPAAEPTIPSIVPALDQAMLRVLDDVAAWATRIAG